MTLSRYVCLICLYSACSVAYAQDVDLALETLRQQGFEVTMAEEGTQGWEFGFKDESVQGAADYARRLKVIIDQVPQEQTARIEYTAEAFNSFYYTLDSGMIWNPPLDDGVPPKNPVFVMIDKPTPLSENRTGLFASVFGKDEFAWLVPEPGGESPTPYQLTIPSEMAQSFGTPSGYRWYFGRWEQVPDNYLWYIPQTWDANPPDRFNSEFEWTRRKLLFDAEIDAHFLSEYHAEETGLRQSRVVGEQVWTSLNLENPQALIPK